MNILDIASLGGFILGLVMVVFGIITSGGVSAFSAYIDFPSVVITIGGSLAGTLACFKLSDFINGLKAFTMTMKEHNEDVGGVITSIIDLSNVARKEGLLALEEAASNIEDPFLKKGIMLVVDGTDPELVRGILETDLSCIEDRHKGVMAVWDKWAELGPAWGMIGTLIGLINMLKDLDDAAAIGPNMAVALITTLYGSLVANWICAPTSAKLGVNNANEIMVKEIMVEGLLSIQAGENPRVIEEKLKSFLAPSVRDSLSTENGGGEA